MSGSFTRARGGRVKVRLGASDCAVVAGLLESVAAMLEPDDPASPAPAAAAAGEGTTRDDDELFARLEAELAVDPPADPAVARLLPDASRDDPELARSFRRLTESDLRTRKRAGLGLAAAALRRAARRSCSPTARRRRCCVA